MKPHRTSKSLAAAVACLALAAPAAFAAPPTVSPAAGSPWGSSKPAPIAWERLSEEQVLASRGKGAPRPPVASTAPAAEPGFDWTAAAIGAGAAAILIVVVALVTPAIGTRLRVRTAR